MKILKRLLLIHWHYFNHEVIEFEKLNFLTGQNASGKSTIIDAIQLILLGDTSGNFFNKAASGRGNRTLIGYLMGELGDDEGSGYRYIRTGRFTSYIALEFYDEAKQRYFTAGCCFDVYSESDHPKLFFIYNGQLHPQGFLNDSKRPIDIHGLRAFLKENYGGNAETTDVGRSFRTKLYGKLGGLRDRFAGLLKKAVSFNPNVDIQEFISDFVCDSQEIVDVSHMQENIRSYKRLEQETSILHEKMSMLGQIIDIYEKHEKAESSEKLYSFLIARAKADIVDEKLRSEKSAYALSKTQLAELLSEIHAFEMDNIELKLQRDALMVQYNSDNEVQTKQNIESEMKEKRQRVKMLTDGYEKAKSILVTCISSWRNNINTMLQKNASIQDDLLHSDIHSHIAGMAYEGRKLLEQLKPFEIISPEIIDEIGDSGLSGVAQDADNLRTHAIELNTKLREEQEGLSNKRGNLSSELKSLESGIYRFPQDVTDLKDAIISRLRRREQKVANVRIVAEVAEIRSDRWRNVIEGYLSSQKFYIIVPQEHFNEALSVFDTIKKSKAIYGTGIVDIEKLKKSNPVSNTGSLAEEIETEDADVRIFLDYILGRVQKCENINQLRNFRTSITDEGMLYNNYVVTAMNKARWANPAIGQGAILRRIDTVKADLEQIGNQIIACSVLSKSLNSVKTMNMLGATEIERIISTASEISEVPTLQAALESLKATLEALDLSAANSLLSRKAKIEADIEEIDKKLSNARIKSGGLEEQQRNLSKEVIPNLERELLRHENEITALYDSEWIVEIAAVRYARELHIRGMPSKISDAFGREHTKATTNKQSAWADLILLRQSYNDRYKMGLDVNAPINESYDNAWLELSNNKLPEYLTLISDAKSKAFEQFQEDFISRLQNNINNAKRQINELNMALKGEKFGDDTYRFRILPRHDYKRFYDMIIDEMITQGGYNMLSQFQEKYREEMNELFEMITNENNIGGGVFEYEKRVQEFTDFRTYLSFDLEAIGHDGESQRLSKTLGKKSGGETQTPFTLPYWHPSPNFTALEEIKRTKQQGLLFLMKLSPKWMAKG